MIALLRRLIAMLDDLRPSSSDHLRPIPGTRGFEVLGRRATPPVPRGPTLTEILEGRRAA